MTHWAFCEDLSNDRAVISDSEAHHLLHVARLQTGSLLTLFDGHGTEATAAIASATRRDVQCRVLAKTVHVRQNRAMLTVFASPSKADRLKWMVEKLTELGVDRLVLLNTQRTIVNPSDTKIDKLRANVVAACKQCHRPFLMDLLPLQNFESVITEMSQQPQPALTFVAHPGMEREFAPAAFTSEQSLQLLIGPEGGFTDNEVQTAVDAGAIPMSWPSTILRIETAAIVFSSLLLSRCASH
jgi:16S rRNA (uracil1498-N3)-methyltransferase